MSSTTALTRLLAHQERADFPFLATNIVDAVTGAAPPWVTPSAVFTVDGVKVGVIGAELENTPGARLGREYGRADLPARGRADQGRIGAPAQARREGPGRGHPSRHELREQHRRAIPAGTEWVGPILDIADALQSTTVDAMIVGHTHRVSNLMRRRHPDH